MEPLTSTIVFKGDLGARLYSKHSRKELALFTINKLYPVFEISSINITYMYHIKMIPT